MASELKAQTNGAAWAAILAAAIGCAGLGAVIDMAEASKAWSARLTFSRPVGNLSGKSTLGVAIWLLAWGLLYWRWRGKELQRTAGIACASTALVLLGLIASFPEVFEWL